MSTRVCWIAPTFLLLACGTTRAQQRVDGSYTIDCKSQKSCLDRAAKLCSSAGYTIIGGRHDQKLYGVPGNQKLVGKDQLFIRCRSDAMVDTPDPSLGSWKLERGDAGPVNTVPGNGRTDTVCRPGETQRCVGSGACQGGQACREDGSGFSPCDCGEHRHNASGQSPSTDGGLP